MLFNSFVFWVFFLFVILLNRTLPHAWQNRMLLVASYVFYGYWDYRFLSLIFFSTVVDYFVGLKLAASTSQAQRKRFLAVSVATNLGLLGFFKYFNFFTAELALLLQALGFEPYFPLINVILPVGISFYTFQTMSYTIDVYRGQNQPTRNFLDFALYVSFFPQLVAGPIERSVNLLPQVLNPRQVKRGDFSEGLFHVLFGLFKKIVIADNMAPIVNSVFSTPVGDLTGTEVLLGVYAFAFQIYGDFSGYSSIAKGIARWLGFDLMWNFKNPYFAVSPSDFWRRWHISLSSWLRDYLYISLGGNRHGSWKTYRNLLLTMLLGGLWHGAAWTFVCWGAYHGLLLIAYRRFETSAHAMSVMMTSRATTVLRMILMFHLICISWLIFRAESMDQVWTMIVLMFTDFGMTELAKYTIAMIVFLTGPLMLFEYLTERKNDLLFILRTDWFVRFGFYLYLVLMMLIFPPDTPQDFIYFQF